jgi:hypothetical protein
VIVDQTDNTVLFLALCPLPSLPLLLVPSMKFRDTLFIAQQMFDIIILATPPTIKALLRSPKLLLSPREVSRIFMATLWVPFAEGMDEHSRPMKVALITPHACGTVLEIGPGWTTARHSR